MKAARMTERPRFSLMKQTDVQSIYYMQMPRWLFFDPRYADMSLDAKVAYVFLLNRFQLSRRKGWTNEHGEVFVIFPRRELASELRICEKRVTSAVRLLIQRELIWEKRCGRGDANQIYLAKVEPVDDAAYQCAPFISEDDCGSRTADIAVLDEAEASQDIPDAHNPPFRNRQKGDPRTAESEALEPPNTRRSKKDINNTYLSEKKVSQSVTRASTRTDGPTDDERQLQRILDACELEGFAPETARVFENAVERLFYSESVRVGNALLPQNRVRSKLRLLDGMVLRETESKLAENTQQRVKNSTAYIMSAILNCISECESDLMVDPYLNRLRAPPEVRK
ncbi:MAG: replication initiator protein A [Oscillospiraceae bacterium]|nr:replication initiator protein A [Oscillospiraceae bacterium]